MTSPEDIILARAGLERSPNAMVFADAEVIDSPERGLLLILKAQGKEATFSLSPRAAIKLHKGLSAAVIRWFEIAWR